MCQINQHVGAAAASADPWTIVPAKPSKISEIIPII